MLKMEIWLSYLVSKSKMIIFWSFLRRAAPERYIFHLYAQRNHSLSVHSSYIRGWLYAKRVKSYNLIFEMVILDVTVSASATRASFFLIDRVRDQCLVGFPANVGLEAGVNDGAKHPLSQCQRRREAPIITVSRASPSRLGLRPAARCALAARCMN